MHRLQLLVMTVALPAGLLTAQASPPPPRRTFLSGVTAGAAKISDARSEQAVSAVLAFQPVHWLTFSTDPSLIRVTDKVTSGTGTVTNTGVGDLPLSVAVEQELPAPWSPTIGASLDVTLPTGDTAIAIGSGETGAGLNVGVDASPTDKLNLSVAASRSLAGITSSTLSAPGATALSVDAAVEVAPHWTASAGFSGDFGSTDPTDTLSHAIAVGVARELGGGVTLSLDGGFGLTPGSPKWSFSIGIGTAFTGFSAVGPTSPFARIKRAFGRGVGQGKSHKP